MSLHKKVRALILGSFVALLAAAPSALAQSPASPTLQSSEPGDGEKLHEPPAEVRLTFSEPLDESSTIIVTDACDRRVDAKDVTVELTEMSVTLAKTPLGVYEVIYEAKGIAGVTGTTTGSIHFELVHGAKSCDGKSGDHGHHGGNGGNGKHDGHGNGGMHEGEGSDDHGAHDSGSNHSTVDHSSDDHSASNHSDMGNDTHEMAGSQHQGHSDHSKTPKEPNNKPDENSTTLAAPGTPVGIPADGKAVAIALSVTALLGMLGGWILRVAA